MNSTTETSHYGLKVSSMPTVRGTVVYAELQPSCSLAVLVGFSRGGWRRYWPLMNGRTWWEPHLRWWFEIHETELTGDFGTHWYKQDGGATTLRGALRRASEAVDEVVRLIEVEVHEHR